MSGGTWRELGMIKQDSPRALAARTFTAADQRWFAAFSGDHNPIHMDPTAARA